MGKDKNENLPVIEDEFQDEEQDQGQEEVGADANDEDASDLEDEKSKYSYAADVEAMAVALINEITSHSHLAEARFRYLFRDGKWNSKGRTVFGKAKLASEDVRFLGEYDFVIMINKEAWLCACPEYRKALVDHELSHCDCSEDSQGNKKWCIADHDVQEFVSVVRRNGLWAKELQNLMIAAKESPYVAGPHNQIDMFHPGDKEDASERPVN